MCVLRSIVVIILNKFLSMKTIPIRHHISISAYIIYIRVFVKVTCCTFNHTFIH